MRASESLGKRRPLLVVIIRESTMGITLVTRATVIKLPVIVKKYTSDIKKTFD
jgi:hypothetical protein